MSTTSLCARQLKRCDKADQASSRFYRPELDALRFVAFFLVYSCHSLNFSTSSSPIGKFLCSIAIGGAFGVDLFFILSAYLITELFRREKVITGTIDITAFYARRILRIWPLYFSFIAIWFLAQKVTPTSFPTYALVAFLLLVGNWYRVATEAHPTLNSPVGILWSVSVEEQFYLIWPLVVRFAKESWVVTIAAALCISSFVTQFALFRGGAIHLVVWFNSFSHGGAIGMGILSAMCLKGRAPRINKYVRGMMFFGALALMGTANFVFHYGDTHTSVLNGMMAFGCGSVGAGVLFFAFLGASQDGPMFLTENALLYLGRISYGLYVFHVAALDVVKYVLVREVGSCSPWLRAVVALLLTIGLACASYRWYEKPFLKLKYRFSKVESGAAEEIR